jgi:nucleoid-associated protein YgaU
MKRSSICLSALIAVLFLVLCGCAAHVPIKEREDAEEMLKAASAAEANIYAPTAYSRAQASFYLAKIEVEKHHYNKAQDLFEESREDSQEALAKSKAAKSIKLAKRRLDTSNLVQLKKYITDVCDIAEESLENAESAFEDEKYNLAMKKAELSLQLSKELPRLMEKKIIEEGKKTPEEVERDKTIEQSKKIMEDTKREAAVILTEAKKEAASIWAQTLEKRYPSVYTVRKRDTMHVIAGRREIYNDPQQWVLIYKANRDQIRDPLQIFVGQHLVIPRAITIEEVREARKQAGATAPYDPPPEAFHPSDYK